MTHMGVLFNWKIDWYNLLVGVLWAQSAKHIPAACNLSIAIYNVVSVGRARFTFVPHLEYSQLVSLCAVSEYNGKLGTLIG